uniref:Uncharacterized protein n=1 Tax=Oryza sativa subsp. japonica TaxID=39947 RepID=Q6H673_ORYSJ|nr:hypothetical protein [Oryza sativa Japonica Group]BAD25776.1 hypothetical protein [Oryza sativa Japonica Group]
MASNGKDLDGRRQRLDPATAKGGGAIPRPRDPATAEGGELTAARSTGAARECEGDVGVGGGWRLGGGSGGSGLRGMVWEAADRRWAADKGARRGGSGSPEGGEGDSP